MNFFHLTFRFVVYLILCQPLYAAGERISVPIGGNSWVKDGKQEKVNASGLLFWNSKEAVIHTYVRFTKPGKVKFFLHASVEGRSTVSVTILGERKEIIMDQAEQKDYHAGEWEIKKPGYLKIELKGITKTSGLFASPTDWILEGDGIDSSISFVKDNKDNYFYWGRRGPSVHLNYPIPADEQIEWFYNEVTVPVNQDVIGSYFMANGFAEGYFGMQVNSDQERRILFSVWSPFKTDDPKSIPKDKQILLLKKGEGVHTGEFGNEGSGGQSYLKYSWKAGNTYKFLLQGKPSEDSTTTYTAYFFAPESNKWSLIACFKRPKTQTYLKRPHSFLENFITETGDIGRMVYFGNQWFCNSAGKWTTIDQAKFSADATARKGYRMDYAGGKEGKLFFLRNCGFFDMLTEIGTEFVRDADKVAPQIDFSKLP